MPELLAAPGPLRPLCASAHAARRGATRQLLQTLAASMVPARDALAALPIAVRAGCPDGYLRHVAYADPQGAFTIVYLIWRQGQFSPVHAHKTWCAYQVLQGELHETHYQWNPDSEQALPQGAAVRGPGDIVTAAPGLGRIHRLGNAAGDIAVSLHIYGVDQADIATGVNRQVEADSAVAARYRPVSSV